MSNDISGGVLAWLRTQGYPLELRAARVLRNAGWYIDHAVWYTDPDTAKQRELDLVATLWGSVETPKKQSASIELAIECKSSQNKPWVVFASPAKTYSFGNFSFVDGFSHDVWMGCCGDTLPLPSIANVLAGISHGVVRAHADNKSGDPTAPYAALSGAMAGASSLGRKHAELALDVPSHVTATIVVPLVILDGLLFEYSLGDEGTEQLVQVPHAAVRVASRGWFGQAVIRIVTMDGLREFMETFTPETKEFLNRLAPVAHNARTSLDSRVLGDGREEALRD